MSDTEPHVAETLEDLPDMTDLLSRSGLEFMQDILSGKLSGPPIGATMGFELTSVEKGRVVFSGTPEFHVTNPMRGVHGGWYGTLLDSCMACALMTMLQKGQHYTTLEYKVNITRAIPLGTRVDGIGFIRDKESDRVAGPVTELRRAGVDAEEHHDGFVIRPAGLPNPTTFDTYDDHRMAMAFSLVGLVVDGVEISDPGCVAKTFPGFFQALDQLR